MSEAQQIDRQSLSEINQKLDLLISSNSTLWTIDDIAQHSKYSKRVAHRIVLKPGFPKPRTIPGTSTKRWVAEEVIQYFKRCK